MFHPRRLWIAALTLAACNSATTLEGDAADVAVEDAAADPGPGDAPADRPDDAAADETPGDVAELCRPQDARPEGPCAAVLDGVLWNGEHCMPLGSGCNCAGADCGRLYDTVADCVADRRACYPNDCEPQAVSDDLCIDCAVEAYLGAFWDGRACFELRGCRCRGAGCAAPFASLEECEAFHQTCPAARCNATGGRWFPEPFGGCGFACGGPREADCFRPIADCLCPAGQTFVPDAGCAPDPSCTERDLCLATRGTWHPAAECVCGFHCGHPGDCEACVDSCDCGPARNFVRGAGCRVDAACSPEWGVDLCESTGGTWHTCEAGDPGCSCGHYHCGRPNTMEPCVMPGCDCGPGANFTAEGCAPDADCYFGGEGAECNGAGAEGSSCRPGLSCCGECGVPGGACRFCRTPCCAETPGCETSGCFPPPP